MSRPNLANGYPDKRCAENGPNLSLQPHQWNRSQGQLGIPIFTKMAQARLDWLPQQPSRKECLKRLTHELLRTRHPLPPPFHTRARRLSARYVGGGLMLMGCRLKPQHFFVATSFAGSGLGSGTLFFCRLICLAFVSRFLGETSVFCRY